MLALCRQCGFAVSAMILGQPLAEFDASAEQTALRGRDRDPKLPCYLRHGHFLNIAKQENPAQKWRNTVDLLPEDDGQFAVSEGDLGCFAVIGKIERHRFIAHLNVVDVEQLRPPLLAQAHQALIHHDPAQPRRELCVLMELLDVLEGLPQCILYLVL